MADHRTPDLSVVVPLFNEEASVAPLHKAITEALSELQTHFEIIFVDDGSTDATYARSAELTRSDPHLWVLKLSRNCGQTPAMAAGIDFARGEIVVTMDGDLQNDPRDIPRFLARLEAGYDVVVGWRQNRQDKLLTRKLPSRIANWMIGKVTGVPIRDNGCSLKAFRASVIKHIPLYADMHRFIPAMTSIAGARIAEISVRHHARQFGESKYGLSRIYKVLLDLITIKTITAFSYRPLFWFSLLSAPAFAIAFACTAAGIYDLLANDGRLAVTLVGTGALFGASGLFLLFGGALGELIYRTGDLRAADLSSLTLRHVRRAVKPDIAVPENRSHA